MSSIDRASTKSQSRKRRNVQVSVGRQDPELEVIKDMMEHKSGNESASSESDVEIFFTYPKLVGQTRSSDKKPKVNWVSDFGVVSTVQDLPMKERYYRKRPGRKRKRTFVETADYSQQFDCGFEVVHTIPPRQYSILDLSEIDMDMDNPSSVPAAGNSSDPATAGGSSPDHTAVASSRDHTAVASSQDHTAVASSQEHTAVASSRDHSSVASARDHASGASSRDHAAVASSQDHAAVVSSSREHVTVAVTSPPDPAATNGFLEAVGVAFANSYPAASSDVASSSKYDASSSNSATLTSSQVFATTAAISSSSVPATDDPFDVSSDSAVGAAAGSSETAIASSSNSAIASNSDLVINSSSASPPQALLLPQLAINAREMSFSEEMEREILAPMAADILNLVCPMVDEPMLRDSVRDEDKESGQTTKEEPEKFTFDEIKEQVRSTFEMIKKRLMLKSKADRSSELRSSGSTSDDMQPNKEDGVSRMEPVMRQEQQDCQPMNLAAQTNEPVNLVVAEDDKLDQLSETGEPRDLESLGVDNELKDPADKENKPTNKPDNDIQDILDSIIDGISGSRSHSLECSSVNCFDDPPYTCPDLLLSQQQPGKNVTRTVAIQTDCSQLSIPDTELAATANQTAEQQTLKELCNIADVDEGKLGVPHQSSSILLADGQPCIEALGTEVRSPEQQIGEIEQDGAIVEKLQQQLEQVENETTTAQNDSGRSIEEELLSEMDLTFSSNENSFDQEEEKSIIGNQLDEDQICQSFEDDDDGGANNTTGRSLHPTMDTGSTKFNHSACNQKTYPANDEWFDAVFRKPLPPAVAAKPTPPKPAPRKSLPPVASVAPPTPPQLPAHAVSMAPRDSPRQQSPATNMASSWQSTPGASAALLQPPLADKACKTKTAEARKAGILPASSGINSARDSEFYRGPFTCLHPACAQESLQPNQLPCHFNRIAMLRHWYKTHKGIENFKVEETGKNKELKLGNIYRYIAKCQTCGAPIFSNGTIGQLKISFVQHIRTVHKRALRDKDFKIIWPPPVEVDQQSPVTGVQPNSIAEEQEIVSELIHCPRLLKEDAKTFSADDISESREGGLEKRQSSHQASRQPESVSNIRATLKTSLSTSDIRQNLKRTAIGTNPKAALNCWKRKLTRIADTGRVNCPRRICRRNEQDTDPEGSSSSPRSFSCPPPANKFSSSENANSSFPETEFWLSEETRKLYPSYGRREAIVRIRKMNQLLFEPVFRRMFKESCLKNEAYVRLEKYDLADLIFWNA